MQVETFWIFWKSFPPAAEEQAIGVCGPLRGQSKHERSTGWLTGFTLFCTIFAVPGALVRPHNEAEKQKRKGKQKPTTTKKSKTITKQHVLPEAVVGGTELTHELEWGDTAGGDQIFGR